MKKSKAYIILIIWAVFSFALTIKLYLENRLHGGTGWAIITAIFIFFIMVYFLSFRKTPLISKGHGERRIDQPHAVQMKKNANYVFLISTKDILKVQAIKDTLVDHNVDCLVLDQHSSEMLRFLPDVEMRVMVPAKDFERSLEVVKDIIKKE